MTSRASAWSYGEYHLQPAAAAAAAAALDQDRHQANQLSSPAPPLPSTSQPSSHYYYGPASSSSNVDSKTSRTMASSFQPRQPPSLNIAAAAAAAAAASTYDQQQQPQQYHYHSTSQHAHQPYSAPAFGNGGGAYYGGSHTNGNGTFAQQPPQGQQQQQAASNGGYGANTNGMPFMLPAPQQSGTAYGGPPMSASSGTSSSSYGGSGGVHNGGGMHANHMHSAPHSTSSFQQHHPRFNSSVTAAQNDEHGAAYGYHQQQQQHGGGGGGGGAIPFNGHSSNGGGAFDGAGNMGHPLLAGHDFDGHSMLPLKSKRKQVKNACINCQKACKRCDEGRPCSRCVKYGLTSSCTNSARKERKRGVKRGPYKRRATTGSHPTPLSGLSSMYGTMSPTSSSTALGGGVGGDSSSSSNGSTHGGGYHSGSGGNMLSATHFHGAAARQQITGASSQYAGHQYAAAQQTHFAADGYSANGGHAFSPAARTASVAPPITSGDVAEPGSATHGLHAHPHPHASSSPLSMYGREHAAYASTMQPPTTSASSRSYVQRPELERSGNSSSTSSSTMASTQSLSFYTNNGARSNEAHFNGAPMQTGGHHPASAPATSSEFASSTTTPNNGGGLGLPSPPAGSAHRGVTVPSLFSPSASGAGSSTYSQSGFLGASGHHRLHSDSGTATLHHGASSSSHSPRTPMGGAGSGSSSSAGEMSFSAATLSSGSSSSHSASGKNALSGNMNGYVHHPDATTVASLAPGTAGAFLHPPSVSASGQPFPLHMPQSVRLRANGGGYHGVGNSDDSPSLRSDLAPLKLMSSPAVGGGAPSFNHNTTSPIMRYQLPSPRTGVTGDARARSYFSKLESGDMTATAYGAA